MQTHEGYFANGRFYPAVKGVRIPERRRTIVTILDEPVRDAADSAKAAERQQDNRANRQREAFQRFMTEMDNTPPLPPEFDEIINQRVNISREVDL